MEKTQIYDEEYYKALRVMDQEDIEIFNKSELTRMFEVIYLHNGALGVTSQIIEADYFTVGINSNRVLYFWKSNAKNPIAAFAENIWLFVLRLPENQDKEDKEY